MLIDQSPIEAGESINGYFLRLAEANGMLHMRFLLHPHAIRLRVSYGAEQLERLASIYGLDSAGLLGANPLAGADEPIRNARFMPINRSAVCPHCLREGSVLRLAWSNVLVTSCTRHRVLLEDRCSNCETPLTWNRSSARFCDCGQDLAYLPTRAAPSFHVALSAKLLGEDLPELSLLPQGMRDQPAANLDDFLWYLHCYADKPDSIATMRRPYPALREDVDKIIESTLEPVLRHWPHGFHDLLHRLDQASDQDSAGLSKQFGHWYRMLFNKFGGAGFAWVHEAFGRYVTQHLPVTLNDRTSRIPRGLAKIKSMVSVAEARAILGVQSQRLMAELDAGRIKGHLREGSTERTFGFIPRTEIDQILQARTEYMSAREVMRRLGVTKTQLERLVEAGAFHRYVDGELPALIDGPYKATEVDHFMEMLRTQVKKGAPLPPERRQTLGSVVVTRASNAQEVLRVYKAVVRGELCPAMMDLDVAGLDRFVFDAQEIDALGAVDRGGSTLTLTQVCEITGWKPEVVAKWVQAGLLSATQVPNGAKKSTLIRIDDLVRFQQRFLVFADLAAASGGMSRYLLEGFERSGGVPLAFDNGSGVRYGMLAPYEEIAKVLKQLRVSAEHA